MRKNQLTLCIIAVLCAGLTGAVRADDSSYKTGESQQHTQTSVGQPTDVNKASKLIGMDVKNQQGEELGQISDIVLNLQDGKVSYAVLGAGGAFGIGEKYLAVPLTAFTQGADQTHLVLQADKTSISQAEGIGANWPAVQDPSFGATPFWQESGQQYRQDQHDLNQDQPDSNQDQQNQNQMEQNQQNQERQGQENPGSGY